MPVGVTPSDKWLVDSLLVTVALFSNEEAGALVGLSYQSIANYRAGEWKRLEHATRRKIMAFLELSLDQAEMERRLAAYRHSIERAADAGADETPRLKK